MFDSIGRPLVVWPCYEPAGEQVALTENELGRHVLLLGSTGCGKSTLLAAAMGQILVRCEEKVGLLVLDAKADGLADQVRDAAWQAGRSKDVMIFGPEGDHTLDLFEPLGSLQGVEAITRRIMLAADPMSGDNAYWQTTTASMYSAAFSLYAAAGKPVHFSAVMEFLRRWFMSPTTTPEIQVLIDQLERDKKPPHPLVTGAIDQAKLWQDLDLRTRSVVQSCLLNVLRPLQSAAAASTFAAASRRGGNPAQAATVGATIVLLIGPADKAWVRALHRFVEFSTGIVVGLLTSALWPEQQTSHGQSSLQSAQPQKSTNTQRKPESHEPQKSS